MARMNWDKVRQQKLMERPKTDGVARKRRTKKFIPPTEKQLRFMAKLEIPYREGMSLGDCSSLISTTLEMQAKNK